MLNIIKKSLTITKDNPVIVLFFVIYLILLSVFLQNLANIKTEFLFTISFIMVLFYNAAFFSGWFAMIKKAVENAKKEYKNEEDRYADILYLRREFIMNVAPYILSVFATFIIYYLLFLAWLILLAFIASKYIGSIDFLLADVKSISQTSAMTLQYLANLPKDKLDIIYSWQILFVCAISLFGILTLFVPPALFYEKNHSKNPCLAFWNSIKATFKHPLSVIGFNIFVAIVVFLLMLLQYLCSFNTILYFIYIIIGVYAFVFILVLIFTYYEKRFTDNCDNGSIGVGQDKICDKSCKED